MELNELYSTAEQSNILVECYKMKKAESMAAEVGGLYFIAIDPFKLESRADEKVKLAHDMGHCIKGAFYNYYSKLDIIEKHEYIADKWAIKKLIPADELQSAIDKGYTEAYQLAEYFEVTEPFMIKACKYYNNNYGIKPNLGL